MAPQSIATLKSVRWRHNDTNGMICVTLVLLSRSQGMWFLQWEGEEIKRVSAEFKYLLVGRIVSEEDDDTPAIEANLKKSNAKWSMFKKVLTREQRRASRRVMGHFYKAIVQSILVYGAETWVINPKKHAKTLDFLHRGLRQINIINNNNTGRYAVCHYNLNIKCSIESCQIYVKNTGPAHTGTCTGSMQHCFLTH